MTLYVWYGLDILSNYTAGWAFALAQNEDQARELIAVKYAGTDIYGNLDKKGYQRMLDAIAAPPDLISEGPYADYIWGSA